MIVPQALSPKLLKKKTTTKHETLHNVWLTRQFAFDVRKTHTIRMASF